MLCKITYQRSKSSDLYQTSGSMTVSQDDLDLAVQHLESNEYEVVSIKWNVMTVL